MKQDHVYFEPVIYPNDTQFLLPSKKRTDRSFEAHPNILNGLEGATALTVDLVAVVDMTKRVIVAITGSREAVIGVQIGLTHAGIRHEKFGVYLR